MAKLALTLLQVNNFSLKYLYIIQYKEDENWKNNEVKDIWLISHQIL